MKQKLHVKQKIEWEMLRENLGERNQNFVSLAGSARR